MSVGVGVKSHADDIPSLLTLGDSTAQGLTGNHPGESLGRAAWSETGPGTCFLGLALAIPSRSCVTKGSYNTSSTAQHNPAQHGRTQLEAVAMQGAAPFFLSTA